jgi:hypothetical protein
MCRRWTGRTPKRKSGSFSLGFAVTIAKKNSKYFVICGEGEDELICTSALPSEKIDAVEIVTERIAKFCANGETEAILKLLKNRKKKIRSHPAIWPRCDTVDYMKTQV